MHDTSLHCKLCIQIATHKRGRTKKMNDLQTMMKTTRKTTMMTSWCIVMCCWWIWGEIQSNAKIGTARSMWTLLGIQKKVTVECCYYCMWMKSESTNHFVDARFQCWISFFFFWFMFASRNAVIHVIISIVFSLSHYNHRVTNANDAYIVLVVGRHEFVCINLLFIVFLFTTNTWTASITEAQLRCYWHQHSWWRAAWAVDRNTHQQTL